MTIFRFGTFAEMIGMHSICSGKVATTSKVSRSHQQLQPFDHLILQQPLRVSLVVDEVAHPTKAWILCEAFDGAARHIREISGTQPTMPLIHG